VRKTWLEEGNRAGSYLNARARELGYLDRNGNISNVHRDEFLNLRVNAHDSIIAAADSVARNLELLRSRGLILDESPAALARYAYIAHHEGRTGAINFLQGNAISQSAIASNLQEPVRGEYLRANGNDINRAYRAFLEHHVDQRVDVTH
jgi:hypothetical protein